MESEECRLLEGVLHAAVANVGSLQAGVDTEHGISSRCTHQGRQEVSFQK